MVDEVSLPPQQRAGGFWLFTALAACELLLVALWGYASFYWVKPVGVVVALIVLAVAVAAVLVMIWFRATRKVLAVVAVVGVTVVVLVASIFLSYVSPVPKQARVEQIAEAADFTVMLPAGMKLEAKDGYGYDPASNLSESGEFTIHYASFELWERSSDAVLTSDELEGLIGLETQPNAEARTTIVVDDTEKLTVGGKPALAASWHEAMETKQGGSGRILIVQFDGLVARMSSDSTDDAGLSFDEMVRIAETFEPVK